MKIKVGAIIAAFVVVMGLYAAAAAAAPKQVMGVIVREGAASIEAGSYTSGKVTIPKVTAPADSFVAVYVPDGDMPGELLGTAAVKAGESSDVQVEVPADKVGSAQELMAVLQVDRGKAGEFEYKVKDPEHSPDRPYYIDAMQVSSKVSVR